MGLAKNDSVAVLESLSPPEGWITDAAFVSTYSLDLVAAAALLTALAGEGEDHENMRSPCLARACERMRDRFRIVCQGGRVAVPRQGAKTLVLADRWIRTVPHDGRERSWHAKLALVRYSPIISGNSASPFWRLWIGSRNLTRDTSWDSAILAEGQLARIPSPESAAIARAAEVLARRAALPNWDADVVQSELGGVYWHWPEDVLEVVSFALWPDADSAPQFPTAPVGTSQVVGVSPFLDAIPVASLARWGKGVARPTLLTTLPALEKMAALVSKPLVGIDELYAMESAPPADAPDPTPADVDQVPELHRGLHAKLIWCRAKDGDHLWLGSANLTSRAWSGLNTECMLHLRVAPAVGDGLIEGLVKGSALIPLMTLNGDPVVEDEHAKQAEFLRNRIAAKWDGKLKVGADGSLSLVVGEALISTGDGAQLSVKLVGAKDVKQWPMDAVSVQLPSVRLHELTELVELHLTIPADLPVTMAWVERATLDPQPTVSRDRAVLSRLMGPRAFLQWLRQLLDDVIGDSEDDRWPPPVGGHQQRSPSHQYGRQLGLPTLESVLRAWTRDRVSVERIDREIGTWAENIREYLPEDSDENDRSALVELDTFLAQWAVIRVGLGLGADQA